MLKRFLATALIAVGGTAMGQVVLQSMDILDGADAGAGTPVGVIVLDGFVDIATTDVWTASGARCVTSNGATLIYGTVDGDGDPNTVDPVQTIVNTGSGNNRYVTLISKPRGRNAAARFDNGAAAVAGAYDPTGPSPGIQSATELNISFFASPPENASSPSTDGYVLRIAISAPGFGTGDVVLGGPTAPAGYGILLATIDGNPDGSTAAGWVNASFDVPAPGGGSYWLWAVPEPASLALLALGALAFRRR